MFEPHELQPYFVGYYFNPKYRELSWIYQTNNYNLIKKVLQINQCRDRIHEYDLINFTFVMNESNTMAKFICYSRYEDNAIIIKELTNKRFMNPNLEFEIINKYIIPGIFKYVNNMDPFISSENIEQKPLEFLIFKFKSSIQTFIHQENIEKIFTTMKLKFFCNIKDNPDSKTIKISFVTKLFKFVFLN